MLRDQKSWYSNKKDSTSCFIVIFSEEKHIKQRSDQNSEDELPTQIKREVGFIFCSDE